IAELAKDETVEYAHPNYMITLDPVMDGADLSAVAGMGFPCIPGIEIPGCDPNATLPCLIDIPGVIQFPPGCGAPAVQDPALVEAPAETIPPVVDPSMDQIYGVGKISAPSAWASGNVGNKKIIVAVIDTGVDYNHEDLAFNMWRNPTPSDKGDVVGFDFVHNDALPFDDQSHGTHCSGTIGAVGGNGIGVSGVSQRVSIMGLKFLTAKGSGTLEDAIRAIEYAADHGVKVISASWGGRAPASETKGLADAINKAKDKGILFVAAAGNEGKDNDKPDEASYPAALDNDNLLAVAATDDQDGMASFSNFGTKSVDVGAPGVKVYSTVPGNQYKAYSGTSMACPHTAGAAALVWATNPSVDYKKVKEALMNSADKVSSLVGKTVTGGRINVAKAIQYLQTH
ncbi:MAG: S8 family peptidase, partial [Bdellovibrionota bacterium]